MSVIVKDYSEQIKQRIYAREKMANRLLLEDIHRAANHYTPYKDGDLREQVSKVIDGRKGIITWKVPYAQYQERGMRANGTHVVKNYTTAGTDKKFAHKAVREAVTPAALKRYFSKI